MRTDISVDLLRRLQQAFRKKFRDSEKIKELNDLLLSGQATYKEANEFGIEVGEILADVYQENLLEDELPDGRMYFNIAEKVIEPTVTTNYELVSEFSRSVQEELNRQAKIGVNAIKVDLDTKRLKGIIEKVVRAETFEDVKWVLDAPIVNFSQAIVDETIHENMDFHAQSGLAPKIVRTAETDACDWCKSVAGTYEYESVKSSGNVVFRRHDRCKCLVDYVTADGKVNVHSGGGITLKTIRRNRSRQGISQP